MSSNIALEQPVSRGGIRSVNYFNGRLLTAADLTREQQASREALARLGMAVGEGVAFGLEVDEALFSTDTEPIVKVRQGLAINPLGQTLWLDADVDVALTRQFEAKVQTANKDFRECTPLQTGSYIVSAGIYLLTICPSTEKVGRAQAGSIEPGSVKCNTDETIEGVKFRLIQLPLQLDENDLAQTDKLRNAVAYSCFGISDLQSFAINPFGAVSTRYGLIDKMRGEEISDCEVPLAIIGWTLDDGITFIDSWAVRRRVTRSIENGRWSFLASDKRQSEAEAMLSQFEDHLANIISRTNELEDIFETEPFTFLPSVGMIPIGVGGLPEKFNLQTLFRGRASSQVGLLDVADLRPLLCESFSHDPIDLRSKDRIQLYELRENLFAVESKLVQNQVIVFAKHTLPYRGRARFDESRWNESRYTRKV
jgi:hypothetical protein